MSKVKKYLKTILSLLPGFIAGFAFSYFYLLPETNIQIDIEDLIIINFVLIIILFFLYRYVKKKNNIKGDLEKDQKRKDRLNEVFPDSFKNDYIDEPGGPYGDGKSLDDVIAEAKKVKEV